MEFLAKTPVRLTLAAVGTALIATGSYMIGKKHGATDTMERAHQVIQETIEDLHNANRKSSS